MGGLERQGLTGNKEPRKRGKRLYAIKEMTEVEMEKARP